MLSEPAGIAYASDLSDCAFVLIVPNPFAMPLALVNLFAKDGKQNAAE